MITVLAGIMGMVLFLGATVAILLAVESARNYFAGADAALDRDDDQTGHQS